MRIELIDLDKHPLVVAIEADGTMVVHSRGICGERAAEVLRSAASALEAEHPPYPCTPGVPGPVRPSAAQGWYVSDLTWSDSSGRVWDLRKSYQSAGGLLWRWTGQVDGRSVPLMGSGPGSMVQSLDVVLALYAPLVVAGGRG
ncbi:phiSA1p31-related protein [Streptomyces globisporus]|uniref:phiSA1p31-related protein n=1 Tax=Streptomyces globisporus TaxID=1908 RepID=UPI003789BB83